jgi:hypothetical protein
MIQRCARGWLSRLRSQRLRHEQLAMELFMREQVGGGGLLGPLLDQSCCSAHA